MVAARRDFEDFLLAQGFSPERAQYWASTLERATHAVTQEEFEVGLERTIDKITAILREEFAKRDIEIATLKTQIGYLVDQRREDLERRRAERQEDLERARSDRRERRALALAVGGTMIALLLRVFGAI